MYSLITILHNIFRASNMWLVSFILIVTVPTTIAQVPEKGVAKVYPNSFQGRKTASNQIYDKNTFTAAHKTLPFGTQVEVTHILNKKKIIVTINDRGPYVKGAIIELSSKAANVLQLKSEHSPIVSLRILNRPSKSPEKFKNQPRPIAESTSLSNSVRPFEKGALYKVQLSPIQYRGYGIQIASYAEYESVIKQIATFKKNDTNSCIIYVDQVNDLIVYKAILGPYPSKNEAETTLRSIQSNYQINDAFIVDLSTFTK